MNIETDVLNFEQPVTVAASESTENDNHKYELVTENRRLWTELKKKDELTVALRDEIYFKQRQLKNLEKSHYDLESLESDNQPIELIREIHTLRANLREKQILVNFLNETLDSLCDQVHLDSLEEDIESLENENRVLNRENSEIKVKLKILEHDNEKMHVKCDNVEAENQKIKSKLEKTWRRLRDKEHSILGLKKFTELAHNLQSRILRSKNENKALKKVIEQLKQVASNYEQLENENTQLKESVRQRQEENSRLIQDVNALRETQVKITDRLRSSSKPEVDEEKTGLRKNLVHYEDQLNYLNEENAKLKSALKAYEKILVENKAQIDENTNQTEMIDVLSRKNKHLSVNIDKLEENMNRALQEKYRLVKDNQHWQSEHDQLAEKLSIVEAAKMNLMSHISSLNRNYEEAQAEKADLRRQLDIYKNTAHNIEAALKIREDEIQHLLKENNELKMNVKQYESQVQMAGKIYKLLR